MKIFKLFIITLVTVFAFGSAKAQVNVRIGPRHPRKVVVVRHRHHYHRHPVVVVRHRRY